MTSECIAYTRHHKWLEVLAAEGVTVADHTMVTHLLSASDGSICGAVGLHYGSATAIVFNAKAVAMCAGSGAYKASGFVLGGDTFDGQYMAVSRANQALQGLAPQTGEGLSTRKTQGSANPDDPRCAYCLSFGVQGANRTADSYGAAPGMPLHMASGVYCGWDVRDGAVPVPCWRLSTSARSSSRDATSSLR